MIYLDTSALVKLVATETESAALRRSIAKVEPRHPVTSALSRAELLRAAHRHGVKAVEKAREVLDAVELGADLVAFIAYDVRWLAAARHAGIPTLTPR